MANVLIIDNERDTVELVSQVLRMLDHQPASALSCQQALERINQKPPDLVLLDLMMPGKDGLETIREIRALPSGEDIPIVVVTASQELDVEERVAASGGDSVHYKPIGLSDLNDMVQQFLPTQSASSLSGLDGLPGDPAPAGL